MMIKNLYEMIEYKLRQWEVEYFRDEYDIYIYTHDDTTAELNALAALMSFNPVLIDVDITNHERIFKIENDAQIIIR